MVNKISDFVMKILTNEATLFNLIALFKLVLRYVNRQLTKSFFFYIVCNHFYEIKKQSKFVNEATDQ